MKTRTSIKQTIYGFLFAEIEFNLKAFITSELEKLSKKMASLIGVNNNNIEDYELLTLEEVLTITKCSKTKYYNMMYDKFYPEPIPKLPGERQSLWKKNEIVTAQKIRIQGGV
jgi:predicted DNA-binding transcriptional regulator AlpA